MAFIKLASVFFLSALSLSVAAQGPARAPADIQLTNGLTLADWVTVNSKPGIVPSLTIAEDAVRLIRTHGPFRELLEVVWRASEAEDLSAAQVTETSAKDALSRAMDARTKLGDWPSLTLTAARAQAMLGDATAARASLKQWLAVAPATDRMRPRIVELMLTSEAQAVTDWARNGEMFEDIYARPVVAPLPARIQPYQAVVDLARKCTGRMKNAVQRFEYSLLNVHDGKSYQYKYEYSALGDGLLRFQMTYNPFAKKAEEIEETESVHLPWVGVWNLHRTRYVGGSLSGESFETNNVIDSLSCSGTFFPLRAGKEFEVQRNETSTTTWAKKTGRDRKEDWKKSSKIRIVQGPLSVSNAVALFKGISISGPTSDRWNVFEVEFEATAEGPSPYSSRSRVLFVEGPNVFISIPKSGDSVSLRELP